MGTVTPTEYLCAMRNGVSQVLWTTNPISALVMLAALALVSPVQLLCCLTAVLAAAPLAFVRSCPRGLVLEGLYTVNPALAGLALPLLLAGNDPAALPWLLPLCAVGGILSLEFTILLRSLTTPRGLAPLGLPFSCALAVLVPLTRHCLPTAQAVPAGPILWDVQNFCAAVCNGLAQTLWIEGTEPQLLAALLVLAAFGLMSPLDALTALWAALLSTAAGVLLGLDPAAVLSGQLGFGPVLLSVLLFGQIYPRTRFSFGLISLLCVLSPILTVFLRVPCSAIGIPTAAIPWSLLSIGAAALKKYIPASR